MTVREVLPIGDVKISVEKEAKPKLTTAELTTIEKPGRPVSASQIEEKEKAKKFRKKKDDRKEPSGIGEAKKDCILIITEKPQAAQKIALALGNAKRNVENKVSYFEVNRNGEKIIVST